MYFNVNFNVFFKLIKLNLLVSELYIYQTARCNDINLSIKFKILEDLTRITGTLCEDQCTF